PEGNDRPVSLLAKSREPDSQSALIRSDEWNRNTPAVHSTGRSAKLPGGLCASRRQVQSGRRQDATPRQRGNKHVEAAEYWRRYLAKDGKSKWAARARPEATRRASAAQGFLDVWLAPFA